MGVPEIKKKARKQKEKAIPPRPKKGDGEVKFVFHAGAASEVYLSGDFVHWDTQMIRMKEGKDGLWKAKVKLPPGRYEYKFIVDGRWVEDIPGVERSPNPFGTENFIKWV